jgi:hypothetical protein
MFDIEWSKSKIVTQMSYAELRKLVGSPQSRWNILRVTYGLPEATATVESNSGKKDIIKVRRSQTLIESASK